MDSSIQKNMANRKPGSVMNGHLSSLYIAI